jgi:hypothetical protein
MPEFDGIHACLVVRNYALEEFHDPDYPFDPIYSHTRYVQAQEDEPFRVQITLRAGFDFCGADLVRCRLFLDDDSAPFWTTFTDPPANGIVREDRSQYIATVRVKMRQQAAGRGCDSSSVVSQSVGFPFSTFCLSHVNAI